MKLFITILTALAFAISVNAQTQSGNVSNFQRNQEKQSKSNQSVQSDQKQGFQKENLRFGGSLGAAFGDFTFVDVSPAVGYQFTPRFQAGMGLIYNYLSLRAQFRDNSGNVWFERISMNIFGFNPYAQFAVIQSHAFHLLLRAEYGLLNYDTNFWWLLADAKREWMHYPMIGGGVLFPMGQSGGFSLQVMWDLNEKPFSIYGSNPIFKAGFMFGL